MCCFSRAVEHVSKTHIFARDTAQGRQILAYSMSVAADQDLAMILPLPVPPSSAEDAVRFIDLHGYPSLFDDMEKGFRPPALVGAPRGLGVESLALFALPRPLVVHDIGDFEASFVPRLADFDRLDARFRIPDDVWEAIPAYADFGFAVFKLRDWGAGPASGTRTKRMKTIHPMAFEFPRRDLSTLTSPVQSFGPPRSSFGPPQGEPSTLFFPTLHIHDGAVHASADFDHALYFQTRVRVPGFFETASATVREIVDLTRSAGVMDADAPLRRIVLRGRHPNRDTVV